MSQPQENRSEPHCIWDSSQSTCTGVVQVPANMPMAFSDDIVLDDATAAAESSANRVLLPPSPPLPVPCKKERAWTEEEHKLFLMGLIEFGRGDWKNISIISVRSKTPSQVASHAQKFFMRNSSQEKKRKSIHDITLDESDYIRLSHSLHHHNSAPVPQNHCLQIAPQGLNLHNNDHQNLTLRSQHGCLDMPPELSNPNQVLTPHSTNNQIWFAPFQNLDIEPMHLPLPNSSTISPQNLDLQHNHALVPHFSTHKQWFAPIQNMGIDAMQSPAMTSSYHNQNWSAHIQNWDTEPSQLPIISDSNNYRTSIISQKKCDLPSENQTNPTDIELSQEQHALSSLPPNNLPPQQKDDEYKYIYDLDRFDSDTFNFHDDRDMFS